MDEDSNMSVASTASDSQDGSQQQTPSVTNSQNQSTEKEGWL